jgi:YHS domain-containing protein
MKKVKSISLALVVAAAMAVSVATTGIAAPPAAQPQTQTTCPVLGGNINKNIYVDYQGQRIYFCCEGCIAEFKKNPEKYLEKLKEAGVTPEAVPGATGKEEK